MMKAAAHQSAASSFSRDSKPTTRNQRADFMVMAMTMSWQLALSVLVPVIGGVEADKLLKTSPACLLVGLALALVASGIVMWRTMQQANRLPVPHLTDAQKRAIRRSYEAEDDE